MLTRVSVTVHSRASRDRLLWDGDELKLWVTQPPVDGAANGAVVRMVAGWLKVAPSRVRLVAGMQSRHKIVEVEGIEALPD